MLAASLVCQKQEFTMINGTTPGLEASADSGMRGRDFRLGVSDCIGLLFVPSSDRLRVLPWRARV